ncbi:RNA-directed DNA polymerase, eukaryota [Tanacetum coccineum]
MSLSSMRAADRRAEADNNCQCLATQANTWRFRSCYAKHGLGSLYSYLLYTYNDFSVKSTREFIDDSMLPKTDVPTRWVKSIPIKINIFAWRVSLDKLPTRLNLSLRGLDIPSIICPLCSIAVESTSHLLFSCQLARQLMIKVVHWWELEYQDFHSYED